jgi:aryl-alcohol dehydrogenase-like predicted oxidoreductase
MDDLVHQGKVLYWGTSVWSAAQIESAVGAAAALRAYRPQVEQPRYNMLDRHIEPEILSVCERHGMGVTVFSPLAQGLLTGKYNEGVPPESRGATSHWLDRELTPENLARVRALSRLALEWGITPSQLALAWILRLSQVSSVITGASNARHVLDNVRAAETRLDGEMLAQVEQVLNGEKSASEGPKG